MTFLLIAEIMEIKTMSTRKLRRRPNDPPPQADSKKRKTNGDILHHYSLFNQLENRLANWRVDMI